MYTIAYVWHWVHGIFFTTKKSTYLFWNSHNFNRVESNWEVVKQKEHFFQVWIFKGKKNNLPCKQHVIKKTSIKQFEKELRKYLLFIFGTDFVLKMRSQGSTSTIHKCCLCKMSQVELVFLATTKRRHWILFQGGYTMWFHYKRSEFNEETKLFLFFANVLLPFKSNFCSSILPLLSSINYRWVKFFFFKSAKLWNTFFPR